jgi:hypothetical protein
MRLHIPATKRATAATEERWVQQVVLYACVCGQLLLLILALQKSSKVNGKSERARGGGGQRNDTDMWQQQ